jgi:uncharacterized protein
MKRFLIIIILILISVFGVALVLSKYASQKSIISPLGLIRDKPLEKYTIENLSKRTFVPGQIFFDPATATTSAYTVIPFHYLSDGLLVTGVSHIPNDALNSTLASGKKPVIIQFRGYVDQAEYTPGEGTEHSAEVFAQNGFITLAPDFLGYGGSASPSSDIFEERFQTYTAALNLIASIGSIPFADPRQIGIWGHSNGGQIALTVLEILGKPFPAVLWAPVSKPFPYSILFYTDDTPDHGKALRKEIAKFETEYDVELYSLPNFLDKITGPIQIHQGTADDAVPEKWSTDFVSNMKEKGIDISYFLYPGADHNMTGSWNQVVSRDIIFFTKYLKQ